MNFTPTFHLWGARVVSCAEAVFLKYSDKTRIFFLSTICLFTGIIDCECQSCLPSGITFTTQAQIDAFSTNYPGRMQILGNVTIDANPNNAITNLNGLLQITSIGGYLRILSNQSLTSLAGLDNLTSIGAHLLIRGNAALPSLSGLDNLTSIGGFFSIESNVALTSLAGLDNLTSIGSSLAITGNSAITNISGIDNINHTTITNLNIFSNAALDLCEVQSICDYLAIPANPATISGKATGCATRTQVEIACLLLPVEFLSLQAQPQKTNTHLTRRTASEVNNSHSDIEHSRNGVSFEAIGRVTGQGATTTPHDYAYTHERPGSGIRYYRLRQVDFDGISTYSNIVSVPIAEKDAGEEDRVILYPDECGVYLLPFVKSTWAPKGQTPIIREQCGYEHLSLIAAISANGNLMYDSREKAYDGDATACFLNKLTCHYRKKGMAVIWDGAKNHSAQPVRNFLTAKPGKIYLERLPPYSPELNASELLWACLKGRLANRAFKNIKELKMAVYEELKKIKNDRNLIRSFFRKKEIGFFS